MHRLMKEIGIAAVVVLSVVSGWARTGGGPSGERESAVIVYADGHRQNLDMADVARIELKTPVTIVFKDGRKQTVSSKDGARIEFESSASALIPGRYHFVGKWEVGEGNGGGKFYITLDSDGEARKTLGASHGTWTVVDGEARISWDDGWHDAIRKVGSKHEKVAFEPGKSFDDTPSNVTAARNTEPKPI
jgi:hypothetical protein